MEREGAVVWRVPPPDGLVQSSASAAGFPAIRPDVDRPMALRCRASMAAARQGRPPSVGTQATSPTHGLLREPTSKALFVRLARGSPLSTALAPRRPPVAPSARSPGFPIAFGTRLSLTRSPRAEARGWFRDGRVFPCASRIRPRRTAPRPPVRSGRRAFLPSGTRSGRASTPRESRKPP